MVKRESKTGIVVLWAVTAILTAAGPVWYILDNRPEQAQLTPIPSTSYSAGPVLALNRATAAELEELPGIGPVLAGRILDWRDENGPFTGPEDLMAVSGIGPAIWEDIAPYIDFDQESEP